MNHLLKLYYGIDEDVTESQYFYYQNQLYFLTPVHDVDAFLQIYQHYRYFTHISHSPSYQIVQNCHGDMISDHHILFVYQDKDFDLYQYLDVFLQPLPYQQIEVVQIKEQWIHKIDQIKGLVKQYAYSFKHKPELVSLIYYYTGMAENSISILNEILSIHRKASLFVGLSLHHKVSQYVYDVMNPVHYMVSTRMRHIVYLLKSHTITCETLSHILEDYYFDVYEILYLYARMFFPSMFFDEVLQGQVNQERIDYYFFNIESERELISQMTQILSRYVSLPKISWIQRKNML